ncbi:heme/copper-type cytochrome/quinol oxidase subunit 4 [Catalinimonas alkaloidigena]|nr:heme/copper-type cytochrome/quinol oxidase subunit 4 [Catalinimonas alkaloidigena]
MYNKNPLSDPERGFWFVVFKYILYLTILQYVNQLNIFLHLKKEIE